MTYNSGTAVEHQLQINKLFYSFCIVSDFIKYLTCCKGILNSHLTMYPHVMLYGLSYGIV